MTRSNTIGSNKTGGINARAVLVSVCRPAARSLEPAHLSAIRSIAAETVCINVSGDCMQPHLAHGAQLRVQSRRFYWPGDLLLVHSQALGLFVHRLIGGYRTGGEWRWLTQADTAIRPDPATTSDAIVGKVVGGDCALEIVSVPFMHRAQALWKFVRFVVNRTIRTNGYG